MIPFEDLTFLFKCDLRNRNIIRLDFNEAALLYKYVKRCKSSVLEIGRMNGGSAILMAAALDGNQIMYSVDVENTDESARNIGNASQEIRDRIKVITGLSINVAQGWKRTLSLVFVDGGHTPTALVGDVSGWVQHIEPGGYIVFHDIRGSGAYLKLEPVLQAMKDGEGWIEVDATGSMVVLQRRLE